MSDIDYEKLADAIAKRLSLLPPQETIIWTAEQCAEYFGISKRHFVDRVSKTYDFPTPIRIPMEAGKHCHDRWYANEVQKWARQYKKAG